ncbi:MAG TPA: UTP--glucose-1-phosphate uridylyltransferase [Candidatus Saccharimonadales bacterium]|nr:UTP--glucose-1-phosphate uridylyltransferase [Candidatus Saccharimonadales bacterium]
MMSQQKVRKAVIAAAGFGTRFLPFTKAMPKEMLPLVDKPIIQFIVEELVEAGIEDIVIVTGYHKRSIEDHFDHMSMELRTNLRQGGKTKLLNETKKISELANFAYIRQKGPYGTGTPVLNAAHLIGDEPFIYTYADDFVVAKPSRFRQLMDTRAKHGGSVLTCVRRDGEEDYKRYGYVAGKELEAGLLDMTTIVEKPGSRTKAPSDLASVSGYLLDPAILGYLQKQLDHHDQSGEFHLQDAMQAMIGDGHHIYGCEVQGGRYYDTGNPLGYLKTVFDFALQRPDTDGELRGYLRQKLQ